MIQFEPIRSDDEFQAALEAIVQDADENGVSLEGGWTVERSTTVGSWDVEIIELVRLERE